MVMYNDAGTYEEIEFGKDMKPIDIKFKFCFLPKKCAFTGRTLWLENAYRLTYHSMMTLDGRVKYYKWCDKIEFIMERIKGNL